MQSGIGIICGIEPDYKLFIEQSTEESNIQLFYNDLAFILDHGIQPNMFPGFLGPFIIGNDKQISKIVFILI